MATSKTGIQKCLDEIKIASLTKVKSFNFSERNLQNEDLITLIKEFREQDVNPESLNLDCNRISELYPLKELDLIALNISNNPIKDVSDLASQTHLLELKIFGIADLLPIVKLKSLVTIECDMPPFYEHWDEFFNLPNLLNINTRNLHRYTDHCRSDSDEEYDDVSLVLSASREIIKRNKKCLLAKAEHKIDECRAIWNRYATTRETPLYEELFEKPLKRDITFFGSQEEGAATDDSSPKNATLLGNGK